MTAALQLALSIANARKKTPVFSGRFERCEFERRVIFTQCVKNFTEQYF
jgi:hypothetical protein